MDSYQYLKKKETIIPILLILFSVAVRIPVILIWGDTSLENEWGILVNNLILHGTLSLKNFDGFDFEIPTSLPNVNSEILNPRNTWENKSEYDKARDNLIGLYQKNKR